jgi:hypothetical protein
MAHHALEIGTGGIKVAPLSRLGGHARCIAPELVGTWSADDTAISKLSANAARFPGSGSSPSSHGHWMRPQRACDRRAPE